MRGPAASRYTGVGGALRFRRRVDVGPNATSSPASSRRKSRIASRMKPSRARGCPMLRVEMKPGATVRHVRPGAISSRLWASEASTSGCRTTGLEVAGNSRRRCVAVPPAPVPGRRRGRWKDGRGCRRRRSRRPRSGRRTPRCRARSGRPEPGERRGAGSSDKLLHMDRMVHTDTTRPVHESTRLGGA